MFWLFADSSRLQAWASMLAATVLILAGGVSPPFLPSPLRTAVDAVFAPVCHQITERSPHLGGIPFAICDRCTGIYVGLVVGVATVGWSRHLWSDVREMDRFVLLGSLVPIGLDWFAPFVGLWTNTPVSRAGTGLIFGVIAASFTANQLLKRMGR